jgi:hypothetical protein
LNALVTYLFAEYHSQRESKLLRKLLYGFVIFKCLYWFLDFSLLFGENSLVYKNSVQLSSLKSTAFILFNSGSVGLAYGFLIVAIVFSGFGLINNLFSRMTACVVWFMIINIDNAIYPTLTGGDFLLQQLLFFNIFLSGYKMNFTEAQSDTDKAFHNTGVLALKIQICLVYFMSALAKLLDADWESGNALSQTFMIHDFSLPFLYNNLNGSSLMLMILSYLIISYQMCFPVMIWFKKIKKPFLAFGVLQHLFIALVMGLPTFGFIMIIAYSIFYAPTFKSKNLF